MSNNTSDFGVSNITSGSGNHTFMDPSSFASRTGKIFTENLGGSVEFSGLFLLLLMGTGVYKMGADMDMAIATMSPAVYFLAMNGFLPVSQSIGVAAMLATATLFIAGLVSFLR